MLLAKSSSFDYRASTTTYIYIYKYTYTRTYIHTVVDTKGLIWDLVPRTQIRPFVNSLLAPTYKTHFQHLLIIFIRFARLVFWAWGSAPLIIVSLFFNKKFNQSIKQKIYVIFI